MDQKNGITYRKLPGLSGQGMRIWGLAFLMFGIVGTSVFQNVLVTEESDFIFVTVGLILQLLHFCAIPVFSFLLVEGYTHTSSIKNYAIRIGILALITELPFNFAMDGNLLGALSFSNGLHFSYADFSLNPVFGQLLSLVLIYLFSRYPGKTIKNILIKALVWFMALVWVEMLHIEYANAMIVVVPVMFFLRNKRMWLVFVGCVAMFLCCVFDFYYIGAPIAFLLIHFYNDEPGEGNRYVNYLAYPVILLVIGLVAKFAF